MRRRINPRKPEMATDSPRSLPLDTTRIILYRSHGRRSRNRNTQTMSVFQVLILWLLICHHSVTVVSMSLLVASGASASTLRESSSSISTTSVPLLSAVRLDTALRDDDIVRDSVIMDSEKEHSTDNIEPPQHPHNLDDTKFSTGFPLSLFNSHSYRCFGVPSSQRQVGYLRNHNHHHPHQRRPLRLHPLSCFRYNKKKAVVRPMHWLLNMVSSSSSSSCAATTTAADTVVTADSPVAAAASLNHNMPLFPSLIQSNHHHENAAVCRVQTISSSSSSSSSLTSSSTVVEELLEEPPYPLIIESSSCMDDTEKTVPLDVNHKPQQPLPESVHLQLTGLVDPTDNNDINNNNTNNNQTMVQVHSIVHNGQTYMALNTPKYKFLHFLAYVGVVPSHGGVVSAAAVRVPIIHTEHVVNNATARETWRQLWNQRRLLTDRTELLAIYASDRIKAMKHQQHQQHQHRQEQQHQEQREKDPEDEKRSSTTTTTTTTSNNINVAAKRGGFTDLLNLYTERFTSILVDEQEQYNHSNATTITPQSPQQQSLVAWLEANYGVAETRRLHADSLSQLSQEQQFDALQHFLNWFRSQFPYFYDRCGSCGASMKDDLANSSHQSHNNNNNANINHRSTGNTTTSNSSGNSSSNSCPSTTSTLAENGTELLLTSTSDSESVVAMPTCMDEITDFRTVRLDDAIADDIDDGHNDDNVEEDEEEDVEEYQTFIGYISPVEYELNGKAQRTELYRCHVCHEFTRFPRYNSAWHVLEQKRGRCGEYSMLLFRFLRALHHSSRWVVDWSDHVWAEILLPPIIPTGTTTSPLNTQQQQHTHHATTTTFTNQSTSSAHRRWIHLDPCEAAIDNNLLYQDWGKKQTYILGFTAPPPLSRQDLQPNHHHSFDTNYSHLDHHVGPWIQDITSSYTSDSWETICQRRDESESEITAAIDKSMVDFQQRLQTLAIFVR